MAVKFVLGCPCGLFERDLSLLEAWEAMKSHPHAFLKPQDLYDEFERDLLVEAERAVMA